MKRLLVIFFVIANNVFHVQQLGYYLKDKYEILSPCYDYGFFAEARTNEARNSLLNISNLDLLKKVSHNRFFVKTNDTIEIENHYISGFSPELYVVQAT